MAEQAATHDHKHEDMKRPQRPPTRITRKFCILCAATTSEHTMPRDLAERTRRTPTSANVSECSPSKGAVHVPHAQLKRNGLNGRGRHPAPRPRLPAAWGFGGQRPLVSRPGCHASRQRQQLLPERTRSGNPPRPQRRGGKECGGSRRRGRYTSPQRGRRPRAGAEGGTQQERTAAAASSRGRLLPSRGSPSVCAQRTHSVPNRKYPSASAPMGGTARLQLAPTTPARSGGKPRSCR